MSNIRDPYKSAFVFVIFWISSFMMKSEFVFTQGASPIMETIYTKVVDNWCQPACLRLAQDFVGENDFY
jgi:hypothetical protein